MLLRAHLFVKQFKPNQNQEQDQSGNKGRPVYQAIQVKSKSKPKAKYQPMNSSEVRNQNQSAGRGTPWVIRPRFHSNGVGEVPKSSLSKFQMSGLKVQVPSWCSATVLILHGDLLCTARRKHSTGAIAYTGALSGSASLQLARVPPRDGL